MGQDEQLGKIAAQAQRILAKGHLSPGEEAMVLDVLAMALDLVERRQATRHQDPLAAPDADTKKGRKRSNTAASTKSNTGANTSQKANATNTSSYADAAAKVGSSGANANSQNANTKETNPAAANAKTTKAPAKPKWTQVVHQKPPSLMQQNWSIPVRSTADSPPAAGVYLCVENPDELVKALSTANVQFTVVCPRAFDGAEQKDIPTNKGVRSWWIRGTEDHKKVRTAAGQGGDTSMGERVVARSILLRAVISKKHVDAAQWTCATNPNQLLQMAQRCINDHVENAAYRVTDRDFDRNSFEKAQGRLSVKVRVQPGLALKVLAGSGGRGVFWTHARREEQLPVVQLKDGTSIEEAKKIPNAWLTHTPNGIALMAPPDTTRDALLAAIQSTYPAMLPPASNLHRYILCGARHNANRWDVECCLTEANIPFEMLCRVRSGWLVKTQQEVEVDVIEDDGRTLVIRQWTREDTDRHVVRTSCPKQRVPKMTDEQFPPLPTSQTLKRESSPGTIQDPPPKRKLSTVSMTSNS